MPSQIGSKSIEIMTTKFDQSNLTGGIEFDPPPQIGWKSIEIDAGRFGCKFIEITLHAWSNLVVIISMDLHPIRPGINYWSNWVEIHCMPPWSNLVVII